MAQDCAHKGDSGFSGFIPGPETTRVPALIKRCVTRFSVATTDPSVDT
jgi:hypothetical protein